MIQKIKILHLEDSSTDAELVAWELKKAKLECEIITVEDKENFEQKLREYGPDIILSDHSLAAFDSFRALELVKESGLDVPFILVTAVMSDEFAAGIMKEGAEDYILKDRLSRLPQAILNSIDKWKVKKEQAKGEKLFRALIEHSVDMKALVLPDGKILYTSPSMSLLLGFSRAEFAVHPVFKFIHSDDHELVSTLIHTTLKEPGSNVRIVIRFLHKHGHFLFCEGVISNMLHDPAIGAIVSNFHDISQKRINELELQRANRLYAFISAINQSIVHIHNEEELLYRACEVATRIGEFKMAFVALLDKAGILHMTSFSGAIDEFSKILHPSIDTADPNHAHFPSVLAIKTDNYALVNDLHADPAFESLKGALLELGIHSTIALPIRRWGTVVGVMGLFSVVKDFFDNREIMLLEEASGDISYALENFEHEKERKRVQQAIIQSEERLSKSQSIAHIGHWEIDLKSGNSLWSDETCRIYGLDIFDKRHTMEDWISYIHPDDLDFVKRKMDLQGESFALSSFEYRIVRKDGTIRFLHTESAYELDDDGIPRVLYGIVHDITDQRSNELKLQHSETKLKEAQSLAHVGSFEIDIINNEMHWSDEQYNIMGYTRGEVIPTLRVFLSIVHADDSDSVVKQFFSLFETFQNSSNEFKLMMRDGSEKQVFCKWEFEFDANQMPLRLFGIMQDITDKKLAEDRIAKSESKLNKAQSLSHIGSFEISAIDYSISWSDEQFRLMGFEPGEVVPTRDLFLAIVHPDDRNALKYALKKAFEIYEDEFIYFKLLHKNGTALDVYSEWRFEFDKNNKPLHLFGIVQDITERKRAEEQLRKSEMFSNGVLNSLSAQIAVINRSGVVISINEAWRRFATKNGKTTLQRTGIGSNYFQVCDDAAKNGEPWAEQALKAMRDVLSGINPLFYLEYPCHSPELERWFGLRITRFESEEPMIVVAHENITNVKKAEQERDNTLHELERRVEERTREIAVKNQGIMDSINYAKRIQVSLLTRESQIAQLFPSSFILAQPSDVISGDFFWCYQRRNKKFIAVADCTGHGVPGGLMSMIGNNLLNQIVIEEHVENPTEILEILDTRLWAAVKGDMDEVKDGLDIALCIVDTHFKELYYAGAVRPLFMSTKSGHIEELIGNRYSIGGGTGGATKHFDTKRFPIIPGQRIYLTTDGYYSQFGGVKGKKYMKSRFKKMLEEIQIQPMDRQEGVIRDALSEWMGSNSQVDDILVVGLEL